MCFYGCSMVAWWVAGIVWRFRPAGKYASGDMIPVDVSETEWLEETITVDDSIYQYLTGYFIKIFYVACAFVFVMVVILLLIQALFMCFCRPKDRDYK